ncbi:MAG: CHAT domain-containing protein [Pseudonocardiaceae bacterium]
MASDFTVRGVEVSGTQRRDEFAALYGGELGYEVRGAVSLAGVGRGGGQLIELAGEDDDVIEVEDVDGVVTFQRAATLVTQARGSGRDGSDLTVFLDQTTRGQRARLAVARRISVSLPPHVATAVATVDAAVGADIAQAGAVRDGLGMIVGRVPGVLLNPVAKAAMQRIVDWIDTPVPDDAPAEQRRKKAKVAGVYRIGPEILLEPGERLASGAPAAGDDPYLVLLHGTFSHTEAAFGALRATPEWASVAGRYPGRALAIEHPTLGRTPAENARDAAALLPEGARLHLVSHSRGGLVGEVLSYAARHDPVLDAYAEIQNHPDVAALPELRRILTERGITVERFVRVACPARGTTLASRRLDRWASFLFNVFNLIPVLRETGVAELVKKFLLTLLEQRTDPRLVPGIEAQMPESPFLRMLLGAQPLDDGLGSITGDVEGSGLARRLWVLGADLFYREDHDYVVPTGSMSGGATRAAARGAFFHGPEVSHGSYFGNADSRSALDAWLAAKPGDVVPRFEAPGPPALPRGALRGAQPRVGVVLVVPGVFGTTLTVDGQPAWPDVAQLVRLGLDRALGTGDGVGALVEDYAPLIAALAARHTVTASPYDPRRPVVDAAAELATAVRARLDAGTTPVHLVTHGAGALVALGALRCAGLLADWRAAGGRAVLLSPPLEGTWLATAQLAGCDELTAALALLDRCATPAGVGKLLEHWPVLADLHPEDPAAANRRQALLPAAWDGITAVYGTAQRTVCGVDAGGTFRTSSAGDGHVLHPATRLDTLRFGPATWFAPAPHADLPSDPDVATAVLELLAGRTPSRLLSAPPAGPPTEAPLPDPRGELLLPTPQELVRTAWGGGRTGERWPVLRVDVVHGHLRSVRCPIMAGHQDGTTLSGAEKALDTHLGGALHRRMAFGQYPGALGTCEMFGVPDGTAPAAVVLGLGDAGDLTPGGLTAGVTQAVLRLAAGYLDRAAPDASPLRVSIASVLMGTALVPPMPVENSLSAVVSGVRQANRRLRDLGGHLVVEGLQIVELYEERAIQAVRAAARLPQDLAGDGGDGIAVEPRLLDGCDGLPGLPRPDYQEGVWRTIRIVAADPAERVSPDERLVELSFTSIGRSARAEQQVNTGQRELIDTLVAEAIGTPNPDSQLFNTLYELLVPTALKGQGYGSENLMLVVDEQAGVLPLEMLASRSHEQGVQPLAVEVGMLRRLETRTFTELTRPSAGKAALIIGDPPGTGRPRLDAAREEARRVHRLLESEGYDVTAIIPDGDAAGVDVVPILNALFRREYRIVHIAGHGNYSADPSRSGVVIGPDAYLGALEIGKMRTTPDLVFLNCCHLGAIRPRQGRGPDGTVESPLRADRLASSISRQLIDNGVRAVVAAGWAVDDNAAADFAAEFYGGLLTGDDLGAAALRARTTVHGRYPSTNTWGAYQIYGPPAFRLDPGRPGGGGDRQPVSRRELADALAALRTRAENAPDSDGVGIAADLGQLLAHVPAQWLGGPERSVVGEVWGLLAHYERAVASYEAVQREWGASVSLKTLEQLVNVRAKWAVQRALHPAQPGPAADELFRLADHSVELLLALGRTPERLSLRGSVARRRAQCLPPEQPGPLTDALVAARDAYHEAVELYRERTGAVDFYPALNEVVLGWLVAQRQRSAFDAAPALELIERSRAAARARRCPDFWCRVTPADADLAEALICQRLPEAVEAVAARYFEAYAESSRRDRTAVLEHLDIIGRALPRGQGKGPSKVAEAVAGLRSRLVSWVSPT